MAVCECLKASGVDVGRLATVAPYAPGQAAPHRHSWLEAGNISSAYRMSIGKSPHLSVNQLKLAPSLNIRFIWQCAFIASMLF